MLIPNVFDLPAKTHFLNHVSHNECLCNKHNRWFRDAKRIRNRGGDCGFYDEVRGWMAEIQWANTYEPLNHIPAHLIAEHMRTHRMKVIRRNPEQFLREVDPETQSSLSSPSGPASESSDEREDIGNYGFERRPDERERSVEVIVLDGENDTNNDTPSKSHIQPLTQTHVLDNSVSGQRINSYIRNSLSKHPSVHTQLKRRY